tara:strand:- start:510 stop:962 length:453 start_codon:yes stop_codon:yes gene_type:complete
LTIQTTTELLDRAAIGLSALCMLHCLALPAAMVLLPSLTSLPFADERFHLALIFVVLPTSLFALFMGCRRHRRIRVLVWGGSGVAVLLGTAIVGHEVPGASWERILTLIGASLVVFGHLQNFSLCRSSACQHEEPPACLNQEPSARLQEK